ncbi:MAG: hypothetical protein KatS3mg115_2369 [Candidatus Poribacteria bacterium]|nr:MAG: hypothetical protein KatS3mg115_2369 [Candidatus Poribacteria bacterium]
MKSRGGLFFLLVVGSALAGWLLGCGGSSPTEIDEEEVGGNLSLSVTVTVSDSRVQPGEFVDISARVNAVRAQSLRFSWVNVTGYGKLIGEENGVVTGPFQIRWQAPERVEAGSVQVEVIQLVVTAIAQVIRVDESGVQTTHDIATETKTIPITIAATP